MLPSEGLYPFPSAKVEWHLFPASGDLSTTQLPSDSAEATCGGPWASETVLLGPRKTSEFPVGRGFSANLVLASEVLFSFLSGKRPHHIAQAD